MAIIIYRPEHRQLVICMNMAAIILQTACWMNMTIITHRPEHKQLVICMNMAAFIPDQNTDSTLDEHNNNYTQTRTQKIGKLYEHGRNYT